MYPNRIFILVFSIFIYASYAECQDLSFTTDCHYVAIKTSQAGNQDVYVVQSTIDDWSENISDFKVSSFKFSADGKHLLYLTENMLRVKTLRTDEEIDFPDVVSFEQQISNEQRGQQWLGCMLKGQDEELLLSTLDKKKSLRYKNVISYQFDANGKGVVIQQRKLFANQSTCLLLWIDLITQTEYPIWNPAQMAGNSFLTGKIIFDYAYSQFLFSVTDSCKATSIWHYRLNDEKAKLLINDSLLHKTVPDLNIDSLPIVAFNGNGSRVLFLAKDILQTPDPAILKSSQNLDLWSYTDPVIMSYQVKFFGGRNFVMSISLTDHSLTRIENSKELVPAFSSTIWFRSIIYQDNNNFQVSNKDQLIVFRWKEDLVDNLERSPGYTMSEYNWSEANRISIYLESIQDGSRQLLKSDMQRSFGERLPIYNFSPDGKFVVFYDEEIGAYYSYDTEIRRKRNISQKILSPLLIKGGYHSAGTQIYQPKGIAGWLKDPRFILIYDCYSDIWKVDVTGELKPINITLSYCKKNNLRIDGWSQKVDEVANLTFQTRNNNTGEYGLLIVDPNGNSIPRKSIFGKHSLTIIKSPYLVSIESNTTPKKYYISRDGFKSIQALEHINSNIQRKISSNKDVISWKTFSGKIAFGNLYKPDDFDSTKRYPVIISYYEGANLYQFNPNHHLGSAGSGLNCIEAIKQGYLVFIPDIRYIDINKTSLEAAYDCVVSGAKFISTLPYINAKKMGLAGHSFGALQTNYIVTHTNMFAAAFSSAGLSDYVSNFGIEENDWQGYPRAESAGQAGLIGNVWTNRDNYLDNSPVFRADKVETPILLVANPNDYRVPSAQGIEFFKALRRWGKRVWMLRYLGGDHGFGRDAEIREMQFFNHYLKDVPAPVWMTRGISAKQKGTTLGLEYDTEIKTPGPGLLMKNEGVLTPQKKNY